MHLDDFIDDAALKALYRPIDEALGLPASVYAKDFYELENRCLFPRIWGAVAVGSQFPEPGDVLPVMLANWPIFLLRREDGEIAAFLNICRHRGMRIVTEPKSRCKQIQCPWHGWTYNLDGKLTGAPNFDGWQRDGRATLDGKNIALRRIGVGEWHDLIFVNIDENAAPFEEHCAPLKGLTAEMDLAALSYAGMWEHSYPGNWKTSMDGGMESYHLPWGHPQLMRGVKTYEQTTLTHGLCYTALSTRYTFSP
jgi:choline monooxygenase